jgi:hypothetical protein
MTRIIPRQHYLILLAHREAIKHYLELVDAFESLALEVTQERDKDGKLEVGGITSSMMTGYIEIDEGLKLLDITVEKKQYKKYQVLPEKTEEKKEDENVST